MATAQGDSRPLRTPFARTHTYHLHLSSSQHPHSQLYSVGHLRALAADAYLGLLAALRLRTALAHRRLVVSRRIRPRSRVAALGCDCKTARAAPTTLDFGDQRPRLSRVEGRGRLARACRVVWPIRYTCGSGLKVGAFSSHRRLRHHRPAWPLAWGVGLSSLLLSPPPCRRSP